MSEQTFKIVVTDDGQVGFFAEDGDFEQGKINIARFLQAIKAAGLNLDEVSDVEMHRHSHVMAHLHDLTHQH